MFDFGDELVVNNYRIPWLIWIQIFVMFLLTLTILLSYFGFSSLDNGDVNDPTIDGSLSLTCSSTPCFHPLSTSSQRTQVTANHDVEQEVSRRRLESNSERDGSSVKDLSPPRTSELIFHPCRYLEAFLKCFGLGSAFKKSRTRDKEHEH